MKQTQPKTWTPEQVTKWEQTKAKGKARYILSQSIWFGVYWFAFLFFGQSHKFGLEKVLSRDSLLFLIEWAAVMGFVFAQLNWFMAEAAYHRTVEPNVDYLTRGRIERWEKIRAKGLAYYIVTRGVLFTVFMCGVGLSGDKFAEGSLIDHLLIVLQYGVGGILGPLSWWYIGEDRYRKDCAVQDNLKNQEGSVIN